MKSSLTTLGQVFAFALFLAFFPLSLQAEEMLSPESFFKQKALQPFVTKVIKEDNVKKALEQLNTLHGQMAEEGWEFFSVIEFVDDEDFEGFFVTYKKKQITAM